MIASTADDLLLVSHDLTRSLRAESAAQRLRAPSATRRALAESLRLAADRLERPPLAPLHALRTFTR